MCKEQGFKLGGERSAADWQRGLGHCEVSGKKGYVLHDEVLSRGRRGGSIRFAWGVWSAGDEVAIGDIADVEAAKGKRGGTLWRPQD